MAPRYWREKPSTTTSSIDRGRPGPFVASVRNTDPADPALPGALHFEFLASRAQRYLLEHVEADFGGLSVFDADLDAIAAMGEAAQRARVAALA